MSEKAGKYGIPTTVQLFNDAGEFDPAMLTHQEMQEQGLGTALGGQTNVDDAAQIQAVKHPVTAFGTATSAVSQFLVGYAGASRVTGVRGMVGGFFNGAITDATVFDPDDDNLSAFMEKTGYAIPLLSEALSTDPEGPEWLNRMRNAAEGVILGGITETAFKGFRAIALARKAKETGSEELATEATRLADGAAAEG